MLKKISIVLFSFYATVAIAGQEVAAPVQSPVCIVQNYTPIPLPQDSLGKICAWALLSPNTNARNAVTALLTYCVAYTLYQTARGIGSYAWTWWKGEMGETLSPSLQRQIEIATAEAIRRNGLGQMAIRRSPSHHDEGTCTCGNCCEARRVRQ